MKSSTWAPLGRGLSDYHAGRRDARLVVHTDFGAPEELPVSVFFRGRAELRRVEAEAVARCRGRVLDAGAGAGAMALLLQEQGLEVTALDSLPEAVSVMRDVGVLDARLGSLFDLPRELHRRARFDTVLMLMNGAGIAGTLSGLEVLLDAVRPLLSEGGQLLIDSTDLREGEDDDGEDPYEGELHYQLEYAGDRGEPFPYLFVDPETFERRAIGGGWHFELVVKEEGGDYLARLTRRSGSFGTGA